MASVFISGYFNSVHEGHIRLMSFAKRLAPKLIVGIYSDDYIEADAGRPLSERLMALKTLNLVDKIVEVDENILNTLKVVNPNFIVKGSEFKGQFNPEEEFVKNSDKCQLIFSPGDMETLWDGEKNQNQNIYHDNNFLNKHNIDLKNLSKTVGRFKTLRVAVVGETIIDDYVDCTALGMSQEDPTIVVKPIEKKRYLGGAAIVAAHAKSLGANVEFVTQLGKDDEAKFTKAELTKLGIKVKNVSEEFRPTILKTRYRANSKTLLRVTRVEEIPLEIALQTKIVSHFKKILNRIDVLIFSDFNYGFISDDMIEQIILTAKKHGVKIAADSQSSSQIGDISRFQGIDLVTPTEREARLAVKSKGDGLTVLCEKLKNKCNLKHVVLTMAEHGLLVHSDQNDENWRTDQIAALNKYPVDVAGAGDSFLTATALALSTSLSIWEAAYLGNVAASVQVSKTGNVPIVQSELEAQLSLGTKI